MKYMLIDGLIYARYVCKDGTVMSISRSRDEMLAYLRANGKKSDLAGVTKITDEDLLGRYCHRLEWNENAEARAARAEHRASIPKGVYQRGGYRPNSGKKNMDTIHVGFRFPRPIAEVLNKRSNKSEYVVNAVKKQMIADGFLVENDLKQE